MEIDHYQIGKESISKCLLQYGEESLWEKNIKSFRISIIFNLQCPAFNKIFSDKPRNGLTKSRDMHTENRNTFILVLSK